MTSTPVPTDGLVRASQVGHRRGVLRVLVTAVVSSFLIQYVSLAVGLAWLAAAVSVEGVAVLARNRVQAGDLRFGPITVLCPFLVSCLWVVHALLLWRTGGHVAQIATFIDLFSVSLYAAVGAPHDRRLQWALLSPPLLTLCAILVTALWKEAPFPMSLFGILASLGACAIIAANAMALSSLNDRLARAAEQAHAANAAKDLFLSNMSHEIRTPLNGVIGLSETLARTPLSEDQREMLALITLSGETLTRLLSDLLDFARLEAGKMSIAQAPFELHPTLRAAIALHSAAAAEKDVTLSFLADESLQGWFLGDAVRLGQVVSNLVSNAVKFTSEGSVTVRARLVPDGEAARLELKVEDTGIGFDPSEGERLFQRFEQADSTLTRSFGGTGLGLAICRGLTQAMGGSIGATSQLGQGSTFRVILPLTPTAPAPSAQEAPPATISREGALNVLVAEDHEVNRKTLGLMLSALGAHADFVETGLGAVEACSRGRFDLILMDMQMPGMDGLEATRRIRAMEAEGDTRTPIIMLSANALAEHVEAATAAGCDLHLAKPVTPRSLLEAVARALEAS